MLRAAGFAGLLLAAGCASPAPRDLSGLWVWSEIFQGSSLEIGADGRVVWKYAGCLDSGATRTSARFRDGTLILGEPLREYLGEPFDRMAYKTFKGEEYLVPELPEKKAPDVIPGVEFEVDPDAPAGPPFRGLRRLLPKDELERRILAGGSVEDQERRLDDWGEYRSTIDDIPFLCRLIESPDHRGILTDTIRELKHVGYPNWKCEDDADRRAHEAAGARLQDLLLGHRDADVRLAVADALTDESNLDDVYAFAAPALRKAWKGDSNARVRLQAALALAVLREKEVGAVLLAALPGAGDRHDDLLLGLALLDRVEAVPAFEARIAAGKFGWREQYVEALGRIRSRSSAPVLAAALRGCSDSLRQQTLMEALAAIGVASAEVRDALIPFASLDRMNFVQVTAVDALVSLFTPSDAPVVDALRRLSERAPDADVREHARKGLESLRRKKPSD